MSKLLSLSLLAVLATSCLVGCGNSAETSVPTSVSSDQAKELEVNQKSVEQEEWQQRQANR